MAHRWQASSHKVQCMQNLWELACQR
ncbi:protein of unknown function [Pseudomonas sp. JV241A]|nr:protein of unknown function [Pseudomonas sp. JV241A]